MLLVIAGDQAFASVDNIVMNMNCISTSLCAINARLMSAYKTDTFLLYFIHLFSQGCQLAISDVRSEDYAHCLRT